MKNTETITIEELPTKFNSLRHAISYSLSRPPPRARDQSIEPVGGCKPVYHEMDPRHPDRIWTTLAIGFAKVYNDLDALERFAQKFLFDFYPQSWGIKEIAKYHGVDDFKLSRAIRYVKYRLEDFLILEGLLPMPSYWEPAQRDHSQGRLRKRRAK